MSSTRNVPTLVLLGRGFGDIGRPDFREGWDDPHTLTPFWSLPVSI